MSDDDRTRRFDLPQDDNPTELLTTGADDGQHDGQPVAASNDSRSRRRTVILAVIGGLLLAAVAVVIILLLSRGSAAPSAAPSPTRSATPSASPTPASTASAAPSTSATPEPESTGTPPPATGSAIESFETTTPTVFCNSVVPSPQYVSFSWTSTGVDFVEFGVVDGGTSTVYFSNLPPSGDNSDFPGDNTNFAYGCPQASITYYLRVVGPDGEEDFGAVTVENIGDKS
jgi:flagellar basal body-associated protein FliL